MKRARTHVGTKWSLILIAATLAPVALADQVITEDVDILASLCVGVDCSNGEIFGADTIRLKENNLRIRFVDTSASSAFPTNDWQLTANDSTNGGANRFSIDDIDAGTSPLVVEAGASSNALVVGASGNIGVGTAAPLVEVHTLSNNTPTLRLEQDASGGYTPQAWDLGGNEANFFLRDRTGGSRLPLRVAAGAPSSSLDVSTTGDVGMGTNSPAAFLHIARASGSGSNPLAGAGIRIDTTPTSAQTSFGVVVTNNGPVANVFQDSDAGETWRQTYGAGAYVVAEAGAAGAALTLSASGNLTIGGVLSEGSSRRTKHRIRAVTEEEVLARVIGLQINRWGYKADTSGADHMGPMAEDFREAFGLGADGQHLAALDAAGVALASVQALNAKLEERNKSLRLRNDELSERLDRLERLVEKLSRR